MICMTLQVLDRYDLKYKQFFQIKDIGDSQASKTLIPKFGCQNSVLIPVYCIVWFI